MIRRAVAALVSAVAALVPWRRRRRPARTTIHLPDPDSAAEQRKRHRGRSSGRVAAALNLAHLPHPLAMYRELAPNQDDVTKRNRWARNMRRRQARYLAAVLAAGRRAS